MKCLYKYEILLHLSRSFQALVLCLTFLVLEHECVTGKKYREVQVCISTISFSVLGSTRGQFMYKYTSSLYGEVLFLSELSCNTELNVIVSSFRAYMFLLQLFGCPVWSRWLDLVFAASKIYFLRKPVIQKNRSTTSCYSTNITAFITYM